MSKSIGFILFFIFGISAVYPQCEIAPYIETHYLKDAKILALRDILSDTNDADYKHPEIPRARIDPYLEKLSAIYENPDGLPTIDSIFDQFKIHANPAYAFPIPHDMMFLEVDTTASWFAPFKQTGVSGLEALDTLISNYQFSIIPDIDFGATYMFRLKSNADFFNITGLFDDFLAITGVVRTEGFVPFDEAFNYQGIPYEIPNFPYGAAWAEVADITYEDHTFTFTLYGGDCMAGCMARQSWEITVSEDCSTVTLSTDIPKIPPQVSVYPNPAQSFIHLQNSPGGLSKIHIYNLQGQPVKTLQPQRSNDYRIEELPAGIYFLQLSSPQRRSQAIKFIKQ